MEPRELQELLRDLLLQANRPEIATVRVTPSGTLRALMRDGSALYVMVPHLGKSGERAPGKPSWPMPNDRDPNQDTVPVEARAPMSMRASTFTDLARRLLDGSGHPAIAGTVSFADAGAVGPHWQPYGFRVEFTDKRAVYLSVVKGWTATGVPDDQLPETVEA